MVGSNNRYQTLHFQAYRDGGRNIAGWQWVEPNGEPASRLKSSSRDAAMGHGQSRSLQVSTSDADELQADAQERLREVFAKQGRPAPRTIS